MESLESCQKEATGKSLQIPALQHDSELRSFNLNIKKNSLISCFFCSNFDISGLCLGKGDRHYTEKRGEIQKILYLQKTAMDVVI